MTPTPLQAKAIAYIGEHHRVTLTDVCAGINSHRDYTRAALTRLVGHGVLTRQRHDLPNGAWTWAYGVRG